MKKFFRNEIAKFRARENTTSQRLLIAVFGMVLMFTIMLWTKNDFLYGDISLANLKQDPSVVQSTLIVDQAPATVTFEAKKSGVQYVPLEPTFTQGENQASSTKKNCRTTFLSCLWIFRNQLVFH